MTPSMAGLAALTLLPFLVLSPAPVRAQEDAYLAKKGAYIDAIAAALDASKPVDTVQAEAIVDLEVLLAAIVGPVALAGVEKAGSLNPSLLYRDEVGSTHLDGLEHSSGDGKLRVLASSRGLLKSWFKAHPEWWTETPEVVADHGAALRSELFYTLAMSSDAGVVRYAELEIATPRGAESAAAMLVVRAQESGPFVPDEIVVGVLSRDRVRLAMRVHETPFAAAEACKPVWDKHNGRAEAAFAAYQASELKDEAAFLSYGQHLADADRAYRACFIERAKAEPAFDRVTQAAQALVNGLAGE